MSTNVTSPMVSAQPRGRSLVFAGTFVLLAVLSAAVAFIPHMGYVALASAFLAVFFAYMGLRSNRQGRDLFEVVVPFSVLNFVYFGVGTMYLVIVPEALQYPALGPFLLPAQALALLGYVCTLVGYGWFFQKTAPPPLARWVPASILVYLVPGAIGALGMSMAKLQLQSVLSDRGFSSSVSFLQQFGCLFYFSWFLLWYMTWARRIRLSTAAALIILMSAMALIVLYFTLGSKAVAVTLIGLPVMAYYEVKRKLPTKSLLAVGLIFVFIIFPLFNTFRIVNRNLDTTRRVDRTVNMAKTWDSDKYLNASLFAFLERVTLVTSIAAIVSDTGRWVDYRYGETLLLAPIGLLIPRFVWPDKPNISIGYEFGVTFRFTNVMDRETEVAPSMVGDFYWNFGVPGVVVGSWLLGLGYRWFYQRYGAGDGFAPVRKSIYAALLPTALLFEGNVGIIVGGFVKVLIILTVFAILVRRLGWLEEMTET